MKNSFEELGIAVLGLFLSLGLSLNVYAQTEVIKTSEDMAAKTAVVHDLPPLPGALAPITLPSRATVPDARPIQLRAAVRRWHVRQSRLTM